MRLALWVERRRRLSFIPLTLPALINTRLNMFTEDLDQFFADFGVSATFGAETGLVIFDAPDINVIGFEGQVVTPEYKITYPSTSFISLENSSEITVDGVNYIVKYVTSGHDGKIKYAYLSGAD